MRVLTLGSGGPAGVNFNKSLLLKGGIEIFGVDSNKYHIHFGSPYVKKMFYINKELGDRYKLDRLNHIIEDNKIDFLHPQPTLEVKFVSEYRHRIKCKTFLPPKNTVDICQDKSISALIWYANDLCDEPISIREW